MISLQLLLYCLVAAGIYLVTINLVLEWVGRRLRIVRGIPPEMLENGGLIGFMTKLAMEFLFLVLIPSLAYAFFYIIVPFTGVRAGLSAALLAFMLGALPALFGLGLRVNISIVYILFLLLGLLLKLGGSLTIIGYLYSL